MADAMETLKNILGDGAEDKIKTVMDSLSDSNDEGGSSLPAVSGEGLSQIMQLKNMMESITTSRDDPRTNLLLSLKPYMRAGRKNSIDSAVRLLGLTNITKMLRK